MKKIILIGATILVATSAMVYASTANTFTKCNECPMGICTNSPECMEKCSNPEECCRK